MSIVAIRCRKHNREQRLPLNILQIVRSDEGERLMRRLSESNQEIRKGAWEQCLRPFADGLYCQHCLNEGGRTPINVDIEDWPDLGLADRPLLFQDPRSFDSAAAAAALFEAFPSIRPAPRNLPAVPSSYSNSQVLERLLPDLRGAVRKNVIGADGNLYSFQAEAIEAALSGSDVIVTTPTASGKTLTYLLPIFQTLLNDPSATALYLSPLVALTEDQLNAVTRLDTSNTDWEAKGARFSNYRVCRKIDFGSRSVTVARYDGQVVGGDRQYIRNEKPQYVMTTPDMLHASLLNGAFNEKQWAYLFRGLRYVVIDELHTYRGIFGASFANLIRRLRRICRATGANPLFLCASATIQKPRETVESLTGRVPVVIDGSNSGAPQNRRTFVIWSGQAEEDARALSTQAKDVLLHTLTNRIRTIAFARSISEINDIWRFVTAELGERGSANIAVHPFMRELRSDTKREIIDNLKRGTLHGVIATTALSMGIDIGNLSAVVIIGFPGSIAALWQQAGRAGRAGEGLIVMIAASNPLDQFFVNHPDVLFDLSAEPIYCNPDNPYIVRGHLLAAARELPIQPEDVSSFGPSAPDILAEMLADGTLVQSGGGQIGLPEDEHRKTEVSSLRGLNFAIPVITDTEDRQVIVEVDAARAQKVLHRYAHYQHINRYYEVTRFDVDFKSQRGHILVKELEDPKYTTTARVERAVKLLRVVRNQECGVYDVGFGDVRSQTTVDGYYKVPLFARNEPFVFQPLGIAAPAPFTYNTHGLWLTFSPALLGVPTGIESAAGLYSLKEALRLAVAVEELCDPSDISAIGLLEHPDTKLPTVLLYDDTPGGIGITEAASLKMDKLLRRALSILDECPYCSKHPESRGCPYCVTAQYGDETTIDRLAAIGMLRQLIEG